MCLAGDSIRSSSAVSCRDSPSVVEDRRPVDLLTPSTESGAPSPTMRTTEATVEKSPPVETDGAAASSSSGNEGNPKKSKRARCFVESCRARLGLTGSCIITIMFGRIVNLKCEACGACLQRLMYCSLCRSHRV